MAGQRTRTSRWAATGASALLAGAALTGCSGGSGGSSDVLSGVTKDATSVNVVRWSAIADQNDGLKDYPEDGKPVPAVVKDLPVDSTLFPYAVVLKEAYGFTPNGSEWEVDGLGEHEAYAAVKVSDSAVVKAVGEKLTAAGYTKEDNDGGAVYTIERDKMKDGGLPFMGVVVAEDQGLVVFSLTPDGARSFAAGSPGQPSDAVKAGLDTAGDALGASIATGDQVCVQGRNQTPAQTAGQPKVEGKPVMRIETWGAGGKVDESSAIAKFDSADAAKADFPGRKDAFVNGTDPLTAQPMSQVLTVASSSVDGDTETFVLSNPPKRTFQAVAAGSLPTTRCPAG